MILLAIVSARVSGVSSALLWTFQLVFFKGFEEREKRRGIR